MLKIWAWIRKYILHRKERPIVPAPIMPITEPYVVLYPKSQLIPVVIPHEAVHQDIGKFMAGKGKGQHKYYRKSMRAKINPEEEK